MGVSARWSEFGGRLKCLGKSSITLASNLGIIVMIASRKSLVYKNRWSASSTQIVPA